MIPASGGGRGRAMLTRAEHPPKTSHPKPLRCQHANLRLHPLSAAPRRWKAAVSTPPRRHHHGRRYGDRGHTLTVTQLVTEPPSG